MTGVLRFRACPLTASDVRGAVLLRRVWGIIWIVTEMDDASIAAKRHDAAAAEYVAARSAYESAVMSGDQATRRTFQERMDAAATAYVETLAEVVAARKAAVPSFEALLADGTMQVDPDSIILDSIVAHSRAKPATAGRPTPPAVGHRQCPELVNLGGWTTFSSQTAAALTAAR